MSRTKVSLVGTLRYSEADGLKYSVRLGKNGEGNAIWLEALSDWDHWPGLGKYPEKPKPADRPTWKERQADPQAVERWTAANKEVEDEWKRASEAFLSALHADLL